MPSSIEMLNAIKNHLKQNSQTAGKTAMQIRLELAESAKRLQQLPDISAEKADMNGLQGEWVNACKDHNPEDRRKVILYFHGGGFISGSCEVYRDLAARISAASGAPVLTVEYRLAPEHVYPAANDDCYSAYCRLLETGLQPENIILGGDSVGATLALMTMITLRESGEGSRLQRSCSLRMAISFTSTASPMTARLNWTPQGAGRGTGESCGITSAAMPVSLLRCSLRLSSACMGCRRC
ncbi:alpha/beta hydrolase fold domain-containing protein [Paenibacillus sonchi]|uniref:Alpha/beta hydrolase fold domain-containing protein n=1 Tax=Paenibacillus sonchi TaxID=373687 RepID=A0A974P961_9BACL|nr:alpha/beta hydrolase fold domain-containing protein [Paenibacillus sonchi]